VTPVFGRGSPGDSAYALAKIGAVPRVTFGRLCEAPSEAESRRWVVATARPEDPGATLEPEKKERPSQNGSALGNVVRAAALTRDGGGMVAQ
jgi:hypothetical protein